MNFIDIITNVAPSLEMYPGWFRIIFTVWIALSVFVTTFYFVGKPPQQKNSSSNVYTQDTAISNSLNSTLAQAQRDVKIHSSSSKKASLHQEVSHSSGSVIQNMNQSPGSVQVGGNLNVNTNRTLSSLAKEFIRNGLKEKTCSITVGVLGSGGEPDELANEIFMALQNAGCRVNGVNHGIGFEPFNGLRFFVPPTGIPEESVNVVGEALARSGITPGVFKDPNQKPDSFYIFVGYKPK